jgi:uncharacterized cupin superfamily protein
MNRYLSLVAMPELDTEGMQVFHPNAEELEREGTPDGAGVPSSPKTVNLRRGGSIDGSLATGEWTSGPGRHDLKLGFDEWVHILEGEAHVTVHGQTRTLRAGDVALFRVGLHMVWDVPRHVRKVWVHRSPRASLVRHAARAVARLMTWPG